MKKTEPYPQRKLLGSIKMVPNRPLLRQQKASGTANKLFQSKFVPTLPIICRMIALEACRFLTDMALSQILKQIHEIVLVAASGGTKNYFFAHLRKTGVVTTIITIITTPHHHHHPNITFTKKLNPPILCWVFYTCWLYFWCSHS